MTNLVRVAVTQVKISSIRFEIREFALLDVVATNMGQLRAGD